MTVERNYVRLDQYKRRRHAEGEHWPAIIRKLDPITLQGVSPKPRRWIVENLIPVGAVTLLTGHGGLGKSLLGLQLQVACSLGRPWIGRPVQQVKSWGFYAEDDSDELHRRLDAILRHYGADAGDLELMMCSPMAGENCLLASANFRNEPLQPTPLWGELVREVRDFGSQLVIVDPVADMFGGDENVRHHARGFIQMLARLARDIDGAVLLCAHPSAAGLATGSGISGSTAWHNSVRSRLYLRRPEGQEDGQLDDGGRVLKTAKANYASADSVIDLEWRDGVFVPPEEPTGTFAGIANRTTERRVLEGLQRLAERGVRPSPNRQAGNSATKEVMNVACCRGLKRHEVEKAIDALFETGLITVEEDGPPSRRRARIVLTDKAVELRGHV